MADRLRIGALILALVLGAAFAIIEGPALLVDYAGDSLGGADRANAINSARQSILFVLGGLIAVFGIWLTWGRDRVNRERAQDERDGNRVARLTDAIKLLSDPSIDIRLYAVYALERSAVDSRRDAPTVLEVLASFIRQRSFFNPVDPPNYEPDPNKPIIEVDADVLAAAAAIAKISRLPSAGSTLQPLNLRNVDLRKARFDGARLPQADFASSNLSGASFEGANLARANFYRAWLSDTCFDDAVMTRVDLIEPESARASFRRAKLYRAQVVDQVLTHADFSGADLSGANLSADLRGANFRGATFYKTTLVYAVDGADFTDTFFRPPNSIHAGARASVDVKGIDLASIPQVEQFDVADVPDDVASPDGVGARP